MIGYREIGSRFVRYYTTFTYKNALSSLRFYQKYPTRERETNRPLMKLLNVLNLLLTA